MKNMKKFVALILAFSLVLVGCTSKPSGGNTPGAGAEQEKFVIRAGIGLNDQHPQFKGLEVFKEYVERESEGRIEVQLNIV